MTKPGSGGADPQTPVVGEASPTGDGAGCEASGCRPSNSPAQGLDGGKRGALLSVRVASRSEKTLRERITSVRGIDLWVGIYLLKVVPKRSYESLIENVYPVGGASSTGDLTLFRSG